MRVYFVFLKGERERESDDDDSGSSGCSGWWRFAVLLFYQVYSRMLRLISVRRVVLEKLSKLYSLLESYVLVTSRC